MAGWRGVKSNPLQMHEGEKDDQNREKGITAGEKGNSSNQRLMFQEPIRIHSNCVEMLK